MLVLSRELGQTIRIGDDVTVVVQFIKGGTVSLGIIAPKSVTVMRAERVKPQPASESGKSPGSENNP